MINKLVSIIINCYNGEKYLRETLNSVRSQTFKNFEVIFFDNCSTDQSAKIFNSFKDKRFKYFKTPKKINLYKSRNLALRKCRGDLITFLDADDWWNENFLMSRKKFFKSSKIYGFSFSNCFHYYEKKRNFKKFLKAELPSGSILEHLLEFYFVKLSTIIIKKELIKKFKFNSNYNIIGDYDLIIRLAEKYRGMAFQDFLVNIRIHDNNFTHKNRQMFYKEFKNWLNNQDFRKISFRKNKKKLFDRLEYLRLIYLLINKKSFSLIFDILKFSFSVHKFKLLLIYFIPNFLIQFKFKYF